MFRSRQRMFSAAVAALVFTTRAVAQQPTQVTPQTTPVPVQSPAPTSITLDEALRRSQQVAPTVVQAQGAIRSAQLSTRTATWSLLPALTVTPQMSLALSNGQSRLDPITGEIISGNSRLPSYSFGAQASYTIFDGFSRNYTLKQRRAQQSGADAQLTVAQYSSDFDTTTAFFTALSSKQLVDVAQSSVTLAEGQLDLASAKLQRRVGTVVGFADGTGELSAGATGTAAGAVEPGCRRDEPRPPGRCRGPRRGSDDSAFYQRATGARHRGDSTGSDEHVAHVEESRGESRCGAGGVSRHQGGVLPDVDGAGRAELDRILRIRQSAGIRPD